MRKKQDRSDSMGLVDVKKTFLLGRVYASVARLSENVFLSLPHRKKLLDTYRTDYVIDLGFRSGGFLIINAFNRESCAVGQIYIPVA